MPTPGSGSVARPTKGRKPPPEEDDAFIRAINRAWAWAAQNTGTVVVAAVLVAVVVGGFFWYRSYRQNLEARAATSLQSVEARAAAGDTGLVQALQGYLESFGDTRPARRARIMLAREQIARGQPGEAITTVRTVVDATEPGTPTGYATRRILAEAQVADGDTAGALATLEGLTSDARFGFQRRQAAAERAELLAARGELREALSVYEGLAEEAEGEEADRYRIRLGQLQARLAAGSGGAGAEQAGDGAEG